MKKDHYNLVNEFYLAESNLIRAIYNREITETTIFVNDFKK